MSKTDPAHYPVDLFAIADQLGMSTRIFSAFKYMARAGKKEGGTVADDLKKAIKCLEMEIARLEPAPPNHAEFIAREYGVGPFDRYAEPPAVRCPKASEPYPYDSTR